MTPPTDIVIGVRNCHDTLQVTLDTLVQHTKNWRIIFVADFALAEDHAVIEDFCNKHPGSLKITTRFQRWFTRSYNLGLRLVRTPWAVILNSDVVLGQGWLDELYDIKAIAEGDGHKVGLVGSMLSGEEPSRYRYMKHPGYVTGHCVLLSMQAIYEASANRGTPGIYLDETTVKCIHIFSDNEICERLNKLDYETLYSYKSAVGHHGGRSWGHQLGSIPGSLDTVAERWES
jgi:hypothetical protein